MSRLFKNLPRPCYFTRWSEDEVHYMPEDGKVPGFHPEDLCRVYAAVVVGAAVVVVPTKKQVPT